MEDDKNKEKRKDSNLALGAGAGLGAYAGWTFTTGSVCPICVVAAPALIGLGLWGRHKTKKQDDSDLDNLQ